MEEKFVDINGIKTFTRIGGTGTPFLILHGWGGSSDSWFKVQKILAKNFQVFVLDLPGFGKSGSPPRPWDVQDYMEFVLDFLETYNIKQYYLLGHSFGGRISIKLSAQFSDSIIKLMLVDSAGAQPIKKKFFKRILSSIASFVSIFSFLPGFKLFRRFFYRFIIRSTDYLKVMGVMKETFLKVISEDLSPYLEKIKAKTMIVWGERDRITPLRDGHFMNSKIQHSDLVILPCNHNPHIEIPEDLSKRILDFLNKNGD
ncbi:alpha/beta hydrolase [Patescibacteria group bacterium]|nr:alpha/beta hydrolase [Patescibacteria group bacterium]MBU4162208.1 alpha/beta hydrolase [Patescibacteria group bacterium]